MLAEIQIGVKDCTTLDGVRDVLIASFRKIQERGETNIGYVSGIITSDGPENIQRNIEKLTKYTDHIRSQYDFPIFSATDVFNDSLFQKLDAENIPPEAWYQFWREVLGEKGLITHMFMTPRWNCSKGAIDEHKTAKQAGMEIQYLYYEV